MREEDGANSSGKLLESPSIRVIKGAKLTLGGSHLGGIVCGKSR
jgi:hypothetical protein